MQQCSPHRRSVEKPRPASGETVGQSPYAVSLRDFFKRQTTAVSQHYPILCCGTRQEKAKTTYNNGGTGPIQRAQSIMPRLIRPKTRDLSLEKACRSLPGRVEKPDQRSRLGSENLATAWAAASARAPRLCAEAAVFSPVRSSRLVEAGSGRALRHGGRVDRAVDGPR